MSTTTIKEIECFGGPGTYAVGYHGRITQVICPHKRKEGNTFQCNKTWKDCIIDVTTFCNVGALPLKEE